jgi:hypothetical protein
MIRCGTGHDRQMEALSLNFTKITYNTVAVDMQHPAMHAILDQSLRSAAKTEEA